MNHKIDVEDPNWVENLVTIDQSETIELYRSNVRIGELILEERIKKVYVKEIIDSKNENHYFVPAYQRGYRWTEKQVNDFLNDVWSWGEEKHVEKYSFQPIVVKKEVKDNGEKIIELIDGQQRMTTLFLILKAGGKSPKYSLTYETRKGSKGFLEKIEDEETREKNEENIDFFHFVNAYNVAEEFFKNHAFDKWLDYLEEKAFFIEYNIGKEDPSEKIFMNLNAGKIPLTNAELVKGLFLKKSNFDEKYLNGFIEISQEWDRIERRLQEENFWAWLRQEPTDKPRIDFVLDIIKKNINENNINEKIIKKNEEESYYVFQGWLNKKEDDHDIHSLWLKIKECFMTLEDWYEDFETYHLVGYLNVIEEKNKKNKIADYYKDFKGGKSKEEVFKIDKPNIDGMDYEKNKREVYNALLLFNILSCVDSGTTRFDFERYSKTKYDIEHIFPHSEFDSLKKDDQEAWFVAIKASNFFDELQLPEEFNLVENFEKIYDDVINYKIEGEQKIREVNGIGNLCLLDKNTNRSYGNEPFPLKVQKIKKGDSKKTKYILPTTKNVFLKYYSELSINNFIWTNEDALNYKSAMQEIFKDYLGGESND